MWKLLSLMSLLLVALPAPAGDVPVYETVLTKRIDGEVTIDTEGNVADHHFDMQMEPKIAALLDGAVRKWKFHPYLVDGRPVNARSRMRVTLAARENEAGFHVSVDNVLFNDGKEDELGKPKDQGKDAAGSTEVQLEIQRNSPKIQYPRYVVNGMTVLALRVTPTGEVEDILATQTTFLNAKATPEQFEHARASMEGNAINAVRRWKFKVTVPPGVVPRPEDLTGTLLVNYVMPGAGEKLLSQTGQWRQETRTLNHAIPWLRDSRFAQEIRASDLDGNSASLMSNASALQLREGGAGTL